MLDPMVIQTTSLSLVPTIKVILHTCEHRAIAATLKSEALKQAAYSFTYSSIVTAPLLQERAYARACVVC
jgi:hypothetical protein